MTSDLLARVASGDSSQREMKFSFGSAVEAFSIGSAGHWQISGPEVRPVHAFLHFDGRTIFVLSTSDEQPAQLNGAILPRTWTALPVPAVLTLGGSSIMFGATSGEPITRLFEVPSSVRERSTSAPPPPPPPPPPLPSRAPLLCAPIAALPSWPPVPRPGSGSMFHADPVEPQPLRPQATVVVQLDVTRALHATAGSAEPTMRSRARLKQARIRRVALGVVGAITIGLVSLSSLRSRQVPQLARTLATTPPQPTLAQPAEPETAAFAASTAQPSAGGAGPDDAAAQNAAPSARPAVPATAREATSTANGGDERAAADAVARAESDIALPLYTKLALAHPQQPVFDAARQILEAKTRTRDGAR